METLNANEISTLSIRVTEEIVEKNLHNFLKTSIINSNLYFSENTYYYFYYNANTFIYEIIFYEKLSSNTILEPFIIVQKLNKDDDIVKVILLSNYFIVSKKNKLLLMKKVHTMDIKEVSLYVNQMYKIQKFETHHISQEYLDDIKQEKHLHVKDEFYPLYPKKSFALFSTFTVSSVILLILMIYTVYYKKDDIQHIKPVISVVNTDSSEMTIKKTSELFHHIKTEGIIIDKIIYFNKKIKTTLYHENKSYLLSFANTYKNNLQIKVLNYNEMNSMFTMEIIIEY